MRKGGRLWRSSATAGSGSTAQLENRGELCAGTNLKQLPLVERRHRQEDLLHDLHPCLQLIVQTLDPNQASEWLGEVSVLEGVGAKRADGRYEPGCREWVKVKRRRTADCAVVGLACDASAPLLVLALRQSDGELLIQDASGASSVIFLQPATAIDLCLIVR